MDKYFKFILLLGIILIFLTGCISDLVVPENDVNSPATEGSSTDENPAGISGTGKGTLKIYLTDAPGDFLQLNIIVSRIEGHISVEGEEEGYWETLKDWTEDEGLGLPVDLLKLQGVSLLLGSMDLDANHYTQLRVFLMKEAELVLEGEEEPVILTIPSSANTGIKLNRPFDIVEGGITKLTLDFDAQKSVIKTGNGKYKMKPVITVLSETYSAEELPEVFGSVSGNVSYYDSLDFALTGIVGANIELTSGTYIFGNTTTTSGEEDEEGNFSLINIPPDNNYTLNIYAGIYGDYSENIEVTAGEDTTVDVVFLKELPGVISGSVVISGTNTAIEGATVTVTLAGGSTYSFERSTETDSLGVFSIEQLPVGIYDLKVIAGGYVDYNASGIAEVTAGGITDIDPIEL